MKLSAQEYTDIMNLYALYNYSSDIGDAEKYGACFTKDGAMFHEGRLIRQGRAVQTEFKRLDQAHREGKYTYRRHWTGGIYLDKSSATIVRGHCYLHSFDGRADVDMPVLVAVAVYEDVIEKEAGEWKFARRDMHFDYQARSFQLPDEEMSQRP